MENQVGKKWNMKWKLGLYSVGVKCRFCTCFVSCFGVPVVRVLFTQVENGARDL